LAIRSAVAGATTTRSADWPSRTWGTSATPVQASVVTGCPDSAAQVTSPTKRRASGVGTTRTSCPDSVSSRSSSHALYAAMPAPTPRTTRADMVPRPLAAFDGLDAEHPLPDLAERDGQRLLLAARLHQRPDVLEQAFAELRVVGVDLPGALRGHDHQPVLAVRDLEKLVDRRADDAVGGLVGLSACHILPSVCQCFIKATSWRHTSWTDVFTSVTSNSSAAASSSLAVASLRSMTSADSVPRPLSLRTSSSHDGGARNTSRAPGTARLTCRAPARSISSRQAMPASSFRFSGSRGVPYLLPANCAHSSSASEATRRSNSSSSTK